MNRKVLTILSFIMIISIFITACSQSSEPFIGQDMATTDDYLSNTVPYEEALDEDSAGSDGGSSIAGASIEPEKVITTIDLGLETDDFDEFVIDMELVISEFKGYIENSNIWYGGYSRSYRHGEYAIRIPRENVEEFKHFISEIGNLINESTNRQDVTSQYKDTESRLRVVETKEERILELLETADVMADIIELERELNNIIYEKEYLTSELMNLDERVDYSTVYLNVEEVERYSNVDDMETGLGTRIANAFKDSMHFFYDSLENLVIFVIYAIPFLIVLAILALIGRMLFRKFKKKD